jgi:hypothetical protein
MPEPQSAFDDDEDELNIQYYADDIVMTTNPIIYLQHTPNDTGFIKETD